MYKKKLINSKCFLVIVINILLLIFITLIIFNFYNVVEKIFSFMETLNFMHTMNHKKVLDK